MSGLRSCGSLQTGNEALLKAKGELDEKNADRIDELQRMKEVGFLNIKCSNYIC